MDWLIGLFSPHICKGCKKRGAALCDKCIFYNTSHKFGRCVVCFSPISGNNLCRTCRKIKPYDRAYVVGERRDALKKIVGDFKYNSERANFRVIARLLDLTLPALDSETVVVPIPTIAPHVRSRGFGHTELVVKNFAWRRELRYDERLLYRTDTSVQHGLGARDRQIAAAKTFRLSPNRLVPKRILLFDDIFTTGATVDAAARLLKSAGARHVTLAIVARHMGKKIDSSAT